MANTKCKTNNPWPKNPLKNSKDWKQRKSLIYWLLTIIYSGLIILLSSKPNPESIFPFAQADKLLHALEFGLLSYLLFQAVFNLTLSLPSNNVSQLVLCLILLYAITDEYHQSFVLGRDGNIWDVVADLSGATLTQWLILKRL